jgi:hypothetical protein
VQLTTFYYPHKLYVSDYKVVCDYKVVFVCDYKVVCV